MFDVIWICKVKCEILHYIYSLIDFISKKNVKEQHQGPFMMTKVLPWRFDMNSNCPCHCEIMVPLKYTGRPSTRYTDIHYRKIRLWKQQIRQLFIMSKHLSQGIGWPLTLTTFIFVVWYWLSAARRKWFRIERRPIFSRGRNSFSCGTNDEVLLLL